MIASIQRWTIVSLSGDLPRVTIKLTILERARTVGLWSLLESDGDRYRIPGEESDLVARDDAEPATGDGRRGRGFGRVRALTRIVALDLEI